MFKTERLYIIKTDFNYLIDYYKEFTDDICMYQYPDSFKALEDAEEAIKYFADKMNQGMMLELMILTKDKEYIGSMEEFGLKEEEIEVGLWIKSSVHRKGYGYEALKGLVDYLNENYPGKDIIYEVDERNKASISLVEKFNYIVRETNDIETESEKKLRLITYVL